MKTEQKYHELRRRPTARDKAGGSKGLNNPARPPIVALSSHPERDFLVITSTHLSIIVTELGNFGLF